MATRKEEDTGGMVKIRWRIAGDVRAGGRFTARFGGVNAGRLTWTDRFALASRSIARSIGRVSLRNNDGGGVWKSQSFLDAALA